MFYKAGIMNKIRYVKGSFPYDKLLVFLGSVSFFRPTVFEKFTLTNIFFNTLLVFTFVAVSIIYFVRKNTVKNSFIFSSLLFFAVMIFSTLTNGGSVSRMAEYALVGATSVIFAFFVIKYEFIYAAHLMKKMSWIYVIVNIAVMILFPNGITTTGNQNMAVYFLGQPTRFCYFYIPALMFCSLGDLYEVNKIKRGTILLYFVCLATLIASWTVGSTIAFLLLIPFYLFGRKKIFDSVLYFFVQLTSFIGLTFFSVQNRYAGFIQSVLHKDITLSSRTYIWRKSLVGITANPIWGTGIRTNEYMIINFGFVHLHNHLLQVLFQFGIVGLFIFGLMLFISCSSLNKYKSFYPAKVIAFYLFIVGIQLLVDTVDGVRNHYVFMMAVGASVKTLYDVFNGHEQGKEPV